MPEPAERSAPHAAAPRGALDHAYARGAYAALGVLALLPMLGLVLAAVELGVVLVAVRGAADVGPVTAVAVASLLLGLAAQAALYVALLRRRVTPDGLARASWIVPVLLAVASVVGVAGSMILRTISARLLAALGGAAALGEHHLRLVVVQAAAAVAGSVLVAVVLLVAFARSRPR